MARGHLEKLRHPVAPEDYKDRLEALQEKLTRILIAYVRQKRSAVILLEGWDAAGKGGLIKHLTYELDPRFFEVVPISAPSEQEKSQHYLTRFWSKLPNAGNWSIFDRTWYGRVAVERVEGYASAEAWGRAYDEINAFERTLTTHGTRVVKLFLHVTPEEQDARLIDRLEQPWKRWKVSAEDFRNRSKRDDYTQAYEDMFERTDTDVAPWNIIGANHKKHARLKGLEIIAEQLSQGVDLSDPPLDEDLRKLAEKEFGLKIHPK